MSRIGRKKINVPQDVTIVINGREIEISGEKGRLSWRLPDKISVEQNDNFLLVKRQDDQKQSKANHGLSRQLIANMLVGVSRGFEKKLEIKGVGYRGQMANNILELHLGFSHKVEYNPPEGITLSIQKNIISISGIDKQQVGQAAAEIRRLKPPELYKGKGIRYAGEIVKLKAGKTAKAKS